MRLEAAKDSLNYEQLLEMVSDCQWQPEHQCVRLARDREASEPILDCINAFGAEMEKLSLQRRLSGNYIHLFLVLLSHQYEAVQKIDGDSVVSGVNRIIEKIGVNLELMGIGNAYTTSFCLLLRSRIPLQWNKFCDFIERREWRISLTQHSGTMSTGTATESIYPGRVNNEPTVKNEPFEVSECSQSVSKHDEKPILSGMVAQAFANEAFAAATEKVLNDVEPEGRVEEPPQKVFPQPESNTIKKAGRWKFVFR